MYNKMKLLVTFLGIFLVSNANAMEHNHSENQLKESPFKDIKQTSNIISNDGKNIGSATIQKASNGVLIEIKLSGLPAGKHGMHFHEVPDCSDFKEGFKKAAGHIMPDHKPHGFLNPEGPHAGNLPNLIVDDMSKAHVELYSNIVSYEGDDKSIFDEDGATLIIHENIDDHFSQPIGGAGGRIACAEFKK